MSRATELARLAVRRHTATGMPLEESIAAAIRQALDEQGQAADLAGLPRAIASAVHLLRLHSHLTPGAIARIRGTSVHAARHMVLRMLRDRIVVRTRRGIYALAPTWKRATAAFVDRLHERRLFGLDHGRNRHLSRARAGAA